MLSLRSIHARVHVVSVRTVKWLQLEMFTLRIVQLTVVVQHVVANTLYVQQIIPTDYQADNV